MAGSLSARGLLPYISQACVECREHAARHLEEGRPGLHVQQHLLIALSTLEHYSTQQSLDETDLRLLARTTHEAAAVCRTEPPAERVVALARDLEAVGRACERVLDSDQARHGGEEGWRRFLFRDLDVEVCRGKRRWHVRHATAIVDDRYLDAALSAVWPAATRHQLASVTIQILDWFERGETPRPPTRDS